MFRRSEEIATTSVTVRLFLLNQLINVLTYIIYITCAVIRTLTQTVRQAKQRIVIVIIHYTYLVSSSTVVVSCDSISSHSSQYSQ